MQIELHSNIPIHYAEIHNSTNNAFGVIIAVAILFFVHILTMGILELNPGKCKVPENLVEIKRNIPVTFFTMSYCYFSTSIIGT